ncbi:hypothetical protein GN956_G7782 [Arapaima gigas]
MLLTRWLLRSRPPQYVARAAHAPLALHWRCCPSQIHNHKQANNNTAPVLENPSFTAPTSSKGLCIAHPLLSRQERWPFARITTQDLLSTMTLSLKGTHGLRDFTTFCLTEVIRSRGARG